MAEEERVRAPGDAVERGPGAVGAAAGRHRKLSDEDAFWRIRTSIARVYQELFHLNDTEAECIATLVPRQQRAAEAPRRREGAERCAWIPRARGCSARAPRS